MQKQNAPTILVQDVHRPQGLTFDENHRIDLHRDSRHIKLVRSKVDSCGESAGLFVGNIVGQKNGFNLT